MSFENPAFAELERIRKEHPQQQAPSTANQLDEGPLAAASRVYLEGMDGKEIDVHCTIAKQVKVKRFGGQPKFYGEFEIDDPDYPHFKGIKIPGSCQLPPNGKNPRCYEGAKFYQWWWIANEKVKPRKNERMAFKRFLGSRFRVRLHTVRKNAKQQPHPEGLQYTVVEDIVALHARSIKSR